METSVKEEVGTVVFVLTKTKEEFSKEEVIQVSSRIDPMVDQFDGYYGRKMAFSIEDPEVLVDVVYYRDVQAFEEAAEKEIKSPICQQFFNTLDSEAEQFIIANPVFSVGANSEKVGIMELVIFRSTMEPEILIEAAKTINPILKEYNGFVQRKLSKTSDDLWLDLVYWTDTESAKKASELIMADKRAEVFFSMIDQESMQFMHLDIAIDTEQ